MLAVAIVDAMVSLLAGPGGMLWASPTARSRQPPGVAAVSTQTAPNMLWTQANGFVPARISIANLVQNRPCTETIKQTFSFRFPTESQA